MVGTCDALQCVSHAMQSALESGQEDRIVRIDFNTAFGSVDHHLIFIFLYTQLYWYWRLCVVYTDTVSL